MAKSIFIPGTIAKNRLMKTVEAAIARMTGDFHDGDTCKLSEIDGMIRFATAGGMFLGGLDKAARDRFVAKVNEKLKAWAKANNADEGYYVIDAKSLDR